MRCLTVRNPWALAIFLGKDIENRDWPTNVRGTVAIHAASGMTKREYEDSIYTISELRCQTSHIFRLHGGSRVSARNGGHCRLR